MLNVATEKTIKFTTTRFGLIEVDEDSILRFVDGVPGFPDAERFVVIPHSEDSPFNWLQSVELPDVAFVTVDPWLFFEDYKPMMSEADIIRLGLEEGSDDSLVILSILTIPSDPKQMTANLKAPVVINPSNNMAKQVILLNEEYITKHPLLRD